MTGSQYQALGSGTLLTLSSAFGSRVGSCGGRITIVVGIGILLDLLSLAFLITFLDIFSARKQRNITATKQDNFPSTCDAGDR